MPRRTRTPVEPAGFHGFRIPLLSEQECRARGIEPGRFPPRETWTQEQREAADRLVEILLPHAYTEALEAMLAELNGELRESAIPDDEKQKLAAERGIALIDAGKWKHRYKDVFIPASWVRQILERFASGESLLLKDEVVEAKPKKRSSRQRGQPRERR